VAFVIAVGGCLDLEGQMRYFRANLFRRLGHPPALLDIANKAALVRGRHGSQAPAVKALRKWLTPVGTAVSVLNLALLTGLVALALGLADQREPRHPGVLNGLPLVGSLSACLTLTLLALLLARRRVPGDSRRKKMGWALFATCAVAFVPFLYYWNLLGLDWH
jgi:hypothetical protein